MQEREFVEESRAVWERLADAVKQTRDGSVSALGAPALRRMHEDYRRTAADLAYAQTHFPRSVTTGRLNRLVGMAHAELYGSSPRRFASLWRFVTVGWPRLVRRNWRPLALSAAVLAGAVALGYVLSFVNYPLARLFLPDALRDAIGDVVERDLSRGALVIPAPLMSAQVTVNNIQAALTAFAGGITFGLLTAFSLAVNGLLLGVLSGVFAKAGLSLTFWSMIVPHGALELPALALAGCAGFMLARPLLFPGDLPRVAALKAASGDAVRVVLGVVPLLLAAGLVEGFLTPADIDPVVKLAFGAGAFALLVAYIALPPRRRGGGRSAA